MPARIAIRWIRHTPHHYQADVAGEKLDCWPTKRKWRFKGTTYTERCDYAGLDKAILDRLATMGEALPALKQKKTKKRGTAAYCRNCAHWERGLGTTQKSSDPWGECHKLPPLPDEEVRITNESNTCSQFEVTY